MEKSMLHHAGFMTGLSKPAIDSMIDIVKGVEPETGYTAILKVSEIEAKMRETRIRRTKTVCTYCGVGCSFDVWTKDRHILKVEPADGPANGVSTCIKGKFAWDFVNSPDRLTTPLIREGDRFREAGWDEALVASGASRVTDRMMLAAARTLAGNSPAIKDSSASLLPPLTDRRRVAAQIAIAVGIEAQNDGVAPKMAEDELRGRVIAAQWTPAYLPFAGARIKTV
jgi:hypothetical protein